MAQVMNCTNEKQEVKACGSWFSFAPKQTKYIKDDRIADFLTVERADQGLVLIPEKFSEDPELKLTEEGKAELAALEQRGLDSYLGSLRALIYNNQVSLRQDLEQANIKADPAVFAAPGELNAMRLVAAYQKGKDDTEQKRVDEIKKLMDKIGTVAR